MTDNKRPNVLVPNPDPSDLTSKAIEKAVGNSESKIMTRIDGMEKAVEVFHADLTRVPTSVDRSIVGLRELLETRLHCMEEDIKGVHAYLDTRGKDIGEQIAHLRELLSSKLDNAMEKTEKLAAVSSERFTRIDTQFIERDKRTDQLSLADKTAVAAALQAAKEAVGAQNTSNSIAIAKSESSFIESIKQLQALFNSAINSISEKVNAVVSRLDRGEGKTSVSDPAIADAMREMAILIRAQQGSQDKNDGRSSGRDDAWKYATGAILLGLALATFYIKH